MRHFEKYVQTDDPFATKMKKKYVIRQVSYWLVVSLTICMIMGISTGFDERWLEGTVIATGGVTLVAGFFDSVIYILLHD